jgi:hypothetical protein
VKNSVNLHSLEEENNPEKVNKLNPLKCYQNFLKISAECF